MRNSANKSNHYYWKKPNGPKNPPRTTTPLHHPHLHQHHTPQLSTQNQPTLLPEARVPARGMISNCRGQRNQRPPSARRPKGRPVQEVQPQTHDNTHWGNSTHHHTPNHLRIGFLNVGRLPSSTPHPKQDALHHAFYQHHVNIMGISEVGLNWTRTLQSHSWQERTIGVFRQQSTTLAWNHHDLGVSPTQWGGVAPITTGLTTSCIKTKGSDPRQLGCWSWTSYSGRQSTTLTIYSVYRPVPNNEGPLSVYQQHFFRQSGSSMSGSNLFQVGANSSDSGQ